MGVKRRYLREERGEIGILADRPLRMRACKTPAFPYNRARVHERCPPYLASPMWGRGSCEHPYHWRKVGRSEALNMFCQRLSIQDPAVSRRSGSIARV